MTYPDIDSTDYPDGTNEIDRPSVEESLANWNGYYDWMIDSVDDVPFDDSEEWWPPQDDHELLEVA